MILELFMKEVGGGILNECCTAGVATGHRTTKFKKVTFKKLGINRHCSRYFFRLLRNSRKCSIVLNLKCKGRLGELNEKGKFFTWRAL